MNRRDFLKFIPAAILAACGLSTPTATAAPPTRTKTPTRTPTPSATSTPTFSPSPAQPEAFDIDAAFSDAQEGAVIDIPPGVYVTDGLSLRNKRYITVNANHAKVYASGSSNASKLDLAGAKGCAINGWWGYSHPNPILPAAELVLGRTTQSDGGDNRFYDCAFGGSHAGATVYNCSHEGNIFINCNISTENAAPAVINSNHDVLGLGLVESSDCLFHLQHCNVMNYGNAPVLILSSGFVSGMTIEKCFFFLGTNGVAIRTETPVDARTYYFHLADIRVEGDGECLLIDNVGQYVMCWNIERIAWQIGSSYIIRSASPIIDSRFDFTFCAAAYSAKWLHLTNGAYLERVDLIGQWDGKTTSE